MIAYHGSIVSGLTELKPFANPDSNLDFPCVYLTTLRPLAAFYIWNKPYKWMNFGFTPEGQPVYVESFPGALADFYGGVQGSIYACDGAFEQNPGTKVPTAVISQGAVRVADEIIIPDALELLLGLERSGDIRIARYHEMGDAMREKQRNMVVSLIRERRSWAAGEPMDLFLRERFSGLCGEVAKGC
ncbi:MAG: hypothetical protein LBN04_05740 [Oscillospiraceae bacterium]|jgi:hypothetical protein|nr:hypothetical protein [Oscillospiraceae bacterium]